MATIIGLENSNFDKQRYRRELEDNHGDELTTERIIAGLRLVEESLQKEGNNWISALKETPFYISSNAPN